MLCAMQSKFNHFISRPPLSHLEVNLGLPQESVETVKQSFPKTSGPLVELACTRLGIGAVNNLTRLLDKPLELNSNKKAMNVIALKLVLWASDKLKEVIGLSSTISSEQALAPKRAFAARLSSGLFLVLSKMERITSRLHARGVRADSKGFAALFDADLQNDLAFIHYHNQDTFYANLAAKLSEHMSPLISSAGRSCDVHPAMSGFISFAVSRPILKEYLAQEIKKSLLQAHSKACDRNQLHEMISDTLDAICESMESAFNHYNTTLESQASCPQACFVEYSYGGAVSMLLRMLNPTVFKEAYTFYTGDQALSTGKDKLSLLLSMIITQKVDEIMAPTSDKWVGGVIDLIAKTILKADNSYISAPSYIDQNQWDTMSDYQKRQALDPKGMSVKAYDKKIRARCLKSFERTGENVARAGLVFEQFLMPIRQRAQAMKSCAAKLFFTAYAWILDLPVVSFFFELIHRFFIWVRLVLADWVGRRQGRSMSLRVENLLETRAPDYLYMYLIDQMIERLINV